MRGSLDGLVSLAISGLMYGGGQRVVIDLADGLADAGVETEIILLGSRAREFDRFAPRVVDYNGRYNRLGTLVSTAWRLRRCLRRDRPLLIHTHGWDADIIGWLACPGLGIGHVVHLHVTPDWIESRRFRHLVRRWLTQRALASCVAIVAVSRAVRTHWSRQLGVDAAVIRVIHNGVDINRFRPRQEVFSSMRIPVIGLSARLEPMKGIEYLIDALGVLAKEKLVFRCRIAGAGNSRESLEARCRSLGIADWTEFLGHVEDMPAFYRGIDVYVLPSVSTEGLPLGVLESMAAGVPVVATNIAGTPEAIRDGVEGLLVPPRDVPALANALRRLLADGHLREAMGRRGRNRAVDSFSLERFSGEVFAIYREILGQEAA